MSYEEYKIRLESELAEVINELKTIAVENKDTGDWIAIPAIDEINGNADENVEADAIEEWDTRSAILNQLEVRHRNIKLALEKITNGNYGICEISGEPIEVARLNANPAARTNIANRDRERELSI